VTGSACRELHLPAPPPAPTAPAPVAPGDVSTSGGIHGALLRQVLGRFATGVVVVTAAHGAVPLGLSVSSFTSVSLDPPLVAFCADRRSRSWPAIRRSGAFCVNVLAEDQEAVSRLFATRGAEKFEGVGWSPAPSGSPRLDGVLAWLDCRIEAVHDGGDHEICLGRVGELGVERDDGPLVYYRGGYGRFEP
jgi:3-hydroxy-9,10-secoandrosta-1,3,5(10)-triene-9,17-dione monooxygenase reductase component